MLPVRGLDAIGRARPDPARWDKVFGAAGHAATFLFCRETAEPGHDLHARMFAPAFGLGEDPATGSAVAAFAGVAAAQAGLADGEDVLRIEQGYEMGRPSVIELALTLRDGSLAAATIAGSVVPVSEGTIEA
jgi:trans-2,3-dihydro-3-hydroxyanthranilate isomerase